MIRNATNGFVVVKIPAESGLKLQRCENLQRGDWVDVPLAEGQSAYEVPTAGAQGFFRLVKTVK